MADVLRMTTADLNRDKSKVKLDADGSDKSIEQYRSSGLQNIDAQEKLRPAYETVESTIRILETATRDGGGKDTLVNAVLEASAALSVILSVEPDVAEAYMDDIVRVLSKNENLEPWRDEILIAARNKLT